MNTQRLTAAGLAITCAVALAWASGQYVLSLVLSAIAVFGMYGRFQVELAPTRRGIVVLLVTLLFAIKYRFFTPIGDIETSAVLTFMRWQNISEYFIWLILLNFFLRFREGLPPVIPLLGLVSIFCVGHMIDHPDQNRQYQFFVLFYVLLSILFSSCCRTQEPSAHYRGIVWRSLAGFVVLVMIYSVGLTGGYLLHRNLTNLDHFLTNLYMDLAQYGAPAVRGVHAVGFSESVKLNSIKQIQQTNGDRIALRVFSESQPDYLRAKVFDVYTGSRWESKSQFDFVSAAEEPVAIDPCLPDVGNLFPIRADVTTDSWRILEIWPSPAIEVAMFIPLGTAYMSVPAEDLVIDEHDVVDSDDLRSGVNYAAAATVIAQADTLEAELRNRYLEIREPLDWRIEDLAAHIFAGQETARQKMAAVEQYFFDNYEYHLGLEVPRGEDPLTYFLVEKPAAHCEYFASGAAMLLRLGHVPCRLVTGFLVDEYYLVGRYWVARNRDAHAWVEAWDDLQQRWVIVEATPASGRNGTAAAGQVQQVWDYVLYIRQELQVALHKYGIRGLGVWLSERLKPLLLYLLFQPRGRLLLAVVLLIVVYLIGRKTLRLWRSRPADPWLASLHRSLRLADRHVRRKGLERKIGETLHQFAARMEAEESLPKSGSDFARWYRQYAKVRYGGPITEETAVRLHRNLIDLRKPRRAG